MRYLLVWLTMVLTAVAANAQAFSDQTNSVGVFGGIGLLEMRNARFAGDGTLAVGSGFLSDKKNYYATWQATPWLETTLRFSDYNNAVGGVDKGVDIKVRIFDEGLYRPAIAVGFQDILGDGVFSGEYLVASKRLYDFDITVGLGFGQLANRSKINNISHVLGSNFRNRNSDSFGSENFKFDSYFSGKNMGLFWGLEYHSPIEGLTAKLEYSTMDKSKIKIFEEYKSKSAFNLGLNYKIKNWIELGAGFIHGNQIALHFTLKQNLNKPIRLGFAQGPEVDEIRVRNLENNSNNNASYKDRYSEDMIFDRIQQMGFVVKKLNLKNDHVEIDLIPNKSAIQDPLVIIGAVLENFSSTTLNFPDKTVSAVLDSNDGKQARKTYRKTPFYQRELNFDSADNVLIANRIFDLLDFKKLSPVSINIASNEIVVTKNVGPFLEIPKNIGRTSRLLTIAAPDSIERFTILSKDRGLHISKVSVLRKDFEKNVNYNSSPEEIFARTIIVKPEDNLKNTLNIPRFPNFEYGVFPDIEGHFGSVKNDHFKGDLNLKLFGRANLSDSLQIYAEVQQHLIGNLDLLPVSNNINVNHVRSNIGLYAAQGTTSLRRLNIEYLKNPLDNFYTRLTMGHLERMYSGISGEVLYRPYGNSISLGAEINYVKQRGYEQLFNMRNYKTVTGHATVNYVNKKYDITSRISFGRYLAKDWGTTIDISRQFASGIIIGASATFTSLTKNISERSSPDKQIYMTVPFDFFWFKQSRNKGNFKFKQLGKNGGQKIMHNTNLFDLMTAGQPESLKNSWNAILN